MEVDLPLYGNAKDFAFQDTFDFKFNNISKVQSLLFRTHVDNGYPVDIALQVYFTDEYFAVLDSMLIPNQIVIPAAPVNVTTGIATGMQSKTTDVPMDDLKIQHLQQTKKLLIRANATTSNGGNTNVKIYDYYKLNVQMGALAKLKL
jgi:hypothetical protein